MDNAKQNRKMRPLDNCCLWKIDMYLITFLVNFAVFCVFLWILRDFADLPEFLPLRDSVIYQKPYRLNFIETNNNLTIPQTMQSKQV